MAQKRQITQDEWERILPAIKARFSDSTTEIGYSVFVKGERQIDVAAQMGVTKQNVGLASKAIWTF
ncbi:TrfB-related DNA-binding protein [Xenorhabdus vietnamensis]|nr:TrfB-related DNA-binding protein [Xenorhabdus vietnamensis]